MRKLLALVLALITALALASCGDDKKAESEGKEQTGTATAASAGDKGETTDAANDTEPDGVATGEETEPAVTEGEPTSDTEGPFEPEYPILDDTWWGYIAGEYFQIMFSDNGECVIEIDHGDEDVEQLNCTYELSADRVVISDPTGERTFEYGYEFVIEDVIFVQADESFFLIRWNERMAQLDLELVGGTWWTNIGDEYYEFSFNDDGSCKVYVEHDEAGDAETLDATYEQSDDSITVNFPGDDNAMEFKYEFCTANVIFGYYGDGIILIRQ